MTRKATLNRASQKGDADTDAIGAVFGLILVVVFIVCWIAFGDSPDEARSKAKAAIEDAGYTNVTNVETAFFACDSHDSWRFRWQGTNQNGKTVRGQVCGGMWFKGWTVRLER